MRFSRLSLSFAPVLAMSLTAGVAFAQSAPAPTQAPAATPPAATAPSTAAPTHQHAHMTMAERFAKANTTNDGHLTLEQAKTGMPTVARHFAAIDKDKKGYVTLDDIHAYYKEMRAQRHQEKSTNG